MDANTCESSDMDFFSERTLKVYQSLKQSVLVSVMPTRVRAVACLQQLATHFQALSTILTNEEVRNEMIAARRQILVTGAERLLTEEERLGVETAVPINVNLGHRLILLFTRLLLDELVLIVRYWTDQPNEEFKTVLAAFLDRMASTAFWDLYCQHLDTSVPTPHSTT